jgi:hypothetical protein
MFNTEVIFFYLFRLLKHGKEVVYVVEKVSKIAYPKGTDFVTGPRRQYCDETSATASVACDTPLLAEALVLSQR